MEISKEEIQPLETETLAYIESVLAESRPFGDWAYIDERTWVHYDRRIEMLTEYLPRAHVLLAAFRQAGAQSRYQVMGDPVVRSAINTALGHFKFNEPYTPLDELEAVLDLAAHYLTEGKHGSPLEAGAPQALRLGSAPYHAWIWHDERTEDVPARIFRRLFKLNLANTGLILRTPDNHTQKMLVQGMCLLSELLPKLARSALNHVHLVVVVEHPVGFQAVTNPSILGTIFLSPLVLKTPWRAAEHLLHEALHQKFVDLEHTHSLLRRGYQDDHSPMIRPLWHRLKPGEDNEWPINRALTVFHVYTCQALFFTIVERQASALEQRYGPLSGLDPAISARRAFDRAHYLGHQLKQEQAKQELGVAGRHFVDWLSDVLYAFDPCPPPSDAYVHLLLDLYDQEAKELKGVMQLTTKKNEPSAVMEDALAQHIIESMIQSEIEHTHHILSLLGKTRFPLPAANGNRILIPAQDNASFSEIIDRFSLTRTYVSQLLRSIPLEAYSRIHEAQEAKTPAELVQKMMEHSGQHINVLIEHLSYH